MKNRRLFNTRNSGVLVGSQLVLLLLSLLIGNQLTAQNFQIKTYNVENGFPSDLTKSMAFDTLGFFWVATDDGLVRYNGKMFSLFTEGYPSKYVKSVFCSSKGDLYAASDMGITKIAYGVSNVDFRVLMEGAVQPTQGKVWYPKTFYEDSHKNVWVSDNRCIYKIDGEKIKTYHQGEIGLPNNYQRSFTFLETDGQILLAITQTGIVFIYNEATDQFITLKGNQLKKNVNAAVYIGKNKFWAAHPDCISEVEIDEKGKIKTIRKVNDTLDIACFYPDEDGKIYAGSWSSGLYIANKMNGELELARCKDFSVRGAVNNIIKHEGIFWCATDNGITLLKSMFFDQLFTTFSDRYIQHIITNADGTVYFTDGNAIFSVNPVTNFGNQIYQITDGLILRLLKTDQGLWFTDNMGFLRLLKNGKIIKTIDLRIYGTSIHFIFRDQNGNIWLCQDGNNGVVRIGTDEKINLLSEQNGLTARISVIRQTKNGKLLFGGTSGDKYLFSYDDISGKFADESLKVPFEHNIPININDIVELKTGEIYLASSHGLLLLNKDKLTRVNIREYSEEDIKAIDVDRYGALWLASSRGILKYHEGEIFLFDGSEGLPSKTITYRNITIDPSNRVWVGTLAGIAFSKNETNPGQTIKPLFLSVRVNNTGINPGIMPIVRKTDFILTDYFSPVYPSEQVMYEYRLVDKDSAWIRSYGHPEILLSGFEYQDYELQVRARQTGNHFWSEPATLAFKVEPVIYFRWWAFFIYGSVIIAIIYLISWYRLRKHERKRLLLNKLVQKRTFELEEKNKEIEIKNKELEIAKDLADQSAKAKADFLSTMSHEIRTPLHGVTGMTNFLLMDNPREDQLDKLHALKFSADNLMMLINDVLDFNKIDAGKIEFESVGFNLHRLLENLVLSLKQVASEKNIELILVIDSLVPANIIGDQIKLMQILNNLIGNAIKFTLEGKVELQISCVEKTSQFISLRFLVSDTGIGIPTEKIDRIFEAFSQASSDTTRKFGGSGLGLAISSKLLNLMESKINVESKPGVGSKFWFDLQFKEYEEETKRDSSPNQKRTFESLNGLKILLVEDNQINVKIVRQFLNKWDVQSDAASTGIEALELIGLNKYDLIFMDLHLPDMDGFEITTEIRKTDSVTPIIALTADGQLQIKEAAIAVGMNDFLTKPFKPENLYKIIVQYT